MQSFRVLRFRVLGHAALVAVLGSTLACAGWIGSSPTPGSVQARSVIVTATAYNSVPEQTDDTPDVAAWGARLRPGMRAIAVSSDLIDLGLRNGTVVRIEGVPGEWTVLDRMHPRWTRKIDLYMGTDVEAALEWGVRSVRIHWLESAPAPDPDPGASVPRLVRAHSVLAGTSSRAAHAAADLPSPDFGGIE